jgi:hypothetical protein
MQQVRVLSTAQQIAGIAQRLVRLASNQRMSVRFRLPAPNNTCFLLNINYLCKKNDMKKLLYLILLVFTLVSCEKEYYYQDFVGQWTPEQDTCYPKNMNVFYQGILDDSVRTTRRIAFSDTISIVISDAPNKVIGGYVSGGALYYNEYEVQSGMSTPTCAQVKIRYYNVKAQLYDYNTLIETGDYDVYVEGQGWDRGMNTYYAKFVRRIIK